MGGFNAVVARPSPLTIPALPPWADRLSAMPQFLLNLDGHCTYASKALTTLLQCSAQELEGYGWRVRLSPHANTPFNPKRLYDHAVNRDTMRLYNPTTQATIVTRIRIVMAPVTSEVTGFFGWTQLVRVHRRRAEDRRSA